MPIDNNARSAAERVSEERLWHRHMAMAEIGATPSGGVNRQALSAEDAAAQGQLIDWSRPLGLKPFTDAVGNLFLRWEGSDPALPPVMIGSHLDSQPTGGRFDGVFGVLSALEAIEAMQEAGLAPLHSIDIVSWMNEEGSRFAPGMMGSEAFAGDRTVKEILPVRDLDGVSVATALAHVRAILPDIPTLPLQRPIAACIEPHIEQAPVLEATGNVIGIVTGMQGKRTFRVTVTGQEGHAGTVPMAARRDALVAATAMVQAMQAAFAFVDEDVRFTVGRFVVTPNAPSVVAGQVVFTIDLRHPVGAVLRRTGDRIEPICEAARGACAVKVERLVDVPPIEFSSQVRDLIREAAGAFNYPALDLLSAAGHDARQINRLAPTGMIFVPCRGGISHNEAEWAEPSHLAAGARVLTAVTVALAKCE
jgi:N-carbamoyl-L-amino-acid hydrolase